MAAEIGRRLLVFLRLAGVLTCMMALIAGILGMHILSGAHGMHATAPSPVAAAQLDGHVGGVVEGTLGQLPAAAAEPTAFFSNVLSPCLDPVTCPTMSATAQECIPAPVSASFEAPGPGAALLASRMDTIGGIRFCHSPSTLSPSPGTLGISRT
ncbi:hypothetical protein ACIQC5_19660 [Paenarthrobacter sp. NPDC092416]|uniref:hypothetical protein n=1 Tax=Paenarthrobacter sp. NPDC092416 TaxID=3364386 RepID=UPI0037FB9DFB